MSKKSKKRLLDQWFLRKVEGAHILGGWEVHAGRWIMDRVIYQNATTYRGIPTYLFVCENHTYAVLRQAPEERWKL